MTEKQKSFWLILIFAVILFGGTYLWRSYRDGDIKVNSTYAFAKILRKVGSLKNGNDWKYEFYFRGKSYQSYRSTHVDYDVKIGDYFLVNFSSKNPNHNRLEYDYKLKTYRPDLINRAWDKIPDSLVMSVKKN